MVGMTAQSAVDNMIHQKLIFDVASDVLHSDVCSLHTPRRQVIIAELEQASIARLV